jgi:hypothetical protein
LLSYQALQSQTLSKTQKPENYLTSKLSSVKGFGYVPQQLVKHIEMHPKVVIPYVVIISLQGQRSDIIYPA